MDEIVPIVGSVIAYLGGGAVVILGFSSWLGKLWAKRILGKEIEELKSKYKIIEAEHSIKFATLHSRRAEVMAEIYSLLCEVENQARLLASPLIEPEDPPKTETYRKTAKLIYKLFETFNKYRIYLTEDTCQKLDEFIQQSRLPINFFNVLNQVNMQDPDGNNVALQNKLKEEFMEVWKEVENKMPDARKSVEVEFRKTFGAVA